MTNFKKSLSNYYYFQISKLATTLNKVECENYDRLRVETREFLQSFYVQLNNQPILFTAFGIYVIDYTLFASIVTGVLGYQVSYKLKPRVNLISYRFLDHSRSILHVLV